MFSLQRGAIMKGHFIIFFCISAVLANPFDAFYKGQPSPIGYGTLFRTIRVQSAHLAETNLFAEEEGECLRRAMCALGTTKDVTEFPKLSLGRGLEHLHGILEQMVEEVNAVDTNARHNFPRLHQAVASYEVGETTKDQVLCDTLFACPTTSRELISQVKDEAETDYEMDSMKVFEIRESRATCKAVGKLCPGISIGCALCGLFSPGTCGDQCIVAGVYCGVSSYACSAEKPSTKRKNPVLPKTLF